MRNKSSKSDIVFHVNTEKRTVVCRLLHCKQIPFERINKKTGIQKFFVLSELVPDIQDTFIGVAHCAPEDQFDEEYGKKLALLRARKQRAHAVNIALREFVKTLDEMSDYIEKECYSKIPSEDEL